MKKDISVSGQLKCFSIFFVVVLPFVFMAALSARNPVIFFSLNFLAGLLIWTYLEYHLHRFWTHNKNADATKEAYKRHVHHHKHPTEIKVTAKQRLILFSASAVLFTISILWNNYFTIVAGFIIGFAWSFFSHWILHQTWSEKLFPHLHRFHIHHHCKYPDRCFGFSTIFWDLIFKTTPPKNSVITEKIIKFYYGHH
jgi:4-hydroxysphinganine ceramide fatty acyl 2-hydroxylase